MSLTLGEKLQQAREARGSSISEVAEQTRISRLYIQAIENNDYRTLPGGIFNKGFVKSYAKYVGLDEQEALNDYSQLILQQDDRTGEESKTYRPEVLTDERANSSSLITIIVAVIILGLMTWGILKLVGYLQNEQTQPVANNSNSANNSTNTNANTNANVSQPMPSTNEIKIEFKPTVEKINVTPTIDGKPARAEDVTVESPKTYIGQQSVRLRYYRGYADKVQIILNGKPITSPTAPTRGNGIEFEINKSNIDQILQSGQITLSNPNAVNTNVRR